MPDIPEYVYLVTVDSEWPVSALADDHPLIADRVELEVSRRRALGNVSGCVSLSRVRVYRARLVDVVEMDLEPTRTVGASLREREQGGPPPSPST